MPVRNHPEAQWKPHELGNFLSGSKPDSQSCVGFALQNGPWLPLRTNLPSFLAMSKTLPLKTCPCSLRLWAWLASGCPPSRRPLSEWLLGPFPRTFFDGWRTEGKQNRKGERQQELLSSLGWMSRAQPGPSAARPSETEARARGSGVDHFSSSGPSTREPSHMSMVLSCEGVGKQERGGW